ncbi:MAG: hypothetical protein U0R52_05185 [Solirubrobacterales bacterium]
MAKDEHRMVFDLRGRRKNVVKVVYAILAILMGLSLFLVIGPVSLTDVIGGGGGSTTGSFDDDAAKVEAKLRKQPDNADLYLSLARIRYSAGSTQVQTDPSTGQQSVSTEARQEFEKAVKAWQGYLKQDPKPPNPNVAQLAANAAFTLAQTSTTAAEAEANLRAAAEAQKIVAEARPSVGAYSNLAYYSYAALEFPQGDEAARKAEAEAPKAQRKQVRTTLAGIRKQAKKFEAQQKLAAKAQQGQGKQELQNPLGGLAGGGLGGAPSSP